MGTVLKRKSMLSLFSTLVILAAFFSFSNSTKAMSGQAPDLSNLENVDAKFDINKDGIQEEIVYDEDGESVGTLQIEKKVNTPDPIEVPEGNTPLWYEITFSGDGEMIRSMKYDLAVVNHEWGIYLLQWDNPITNVYDGYVPWNRGFDIRNLHEFYGPPAHMIYYTHIGDLAQDRIIGEAKLDVQGVAGYLYVDYTFENY
ncbi:hypothetical protein [Jeotgalibacillus marinus]|uniref:Uncharacterized protein n=1 Tax=Jeotgalibacillus marinus TaxID=86667 RepID=A0ABV3Q4Q4_9BACL